MDDEFHAEVGLKKLLLPYYNKVTSITLKEQQQHYQQIAANDVISLDAFIPGNFNLQISRLFDLFGLHQKGYTNRPGSQELDKQLEAIPEGNYCLFDDDIHTGKTINYVRNILGKGGKNVLAIIAMNLYQKGL